MKLAFTKMNGLGNDVMVVEWPKGKPPPPPDLVRRWGDRHRGVGFDQLMLIESEPPAVGDVGYRVFNADGGEVEQCGNGVRCVASLLAPRFGKNLTLVSPAGPVAARVLTADRASVDLGVPDFRPGTLPFITAAEHDRYELDVGGRRIEFGAVSMGNPHVVIPVESVDAAPVATLGPEFQRLRSFPQSVNVGFMQVVNEKAIRLRVYERGAGETLACGTGAAAAVAVGRRWGLLGSEVVVSLPGGDLTVSWPGPGSPLWQTGATTAVYEGYIEL